MDSFGRTFRRIIFAVILLGVVLPVLYFHKDIEDKQSFRWIDRPINFVINPISRAIVWVEDKFHATFQHYFWLVSLAKENTRLKQEIQSYEVDIIQHREVEKERDRLLALLSMKKEDNSSWIGGRVISFSPTGPFRQLTIDQGSEDGVQKRAAVISSQGLLGQVNKVMPHSSQVLLIIDPTSAVDVRIDGTDARGLVVGRSKKLELNRDFFIGVFEYLNQTAQIDDGVAVTTSGLDGIYPEGLLVGYVHGNKKKKFEIFQEAEVLPSVDFFKVREVLIQKK
ncbi:MAG: rod shape-determining protein MreC [Deltaproteobacteria bacterium]|nr:MAG: rod shape-determining protein MreC [Deltaproteobacteria bacterium]